MSEQVNVKLPDELNRSVDRAVENGLYISRQELIRDAVRRLLESVSLENAKEATNDRNTQETS